MDKDLLSLKQRLETIKQTYNLIERDTESLKKAIDLTTWKANVLEADKSYKAVCSNLEEQGVSFSRLDDLLEKKELRLRN